MSVQYYFSCLNRFLLNYYFFDRKILQKNIQNNDMECNLKSGAIFSSCRKYRYALWRNWDESKPRPMIIGLNPSTADEKENDPTIVRCINFAKSWGYGGVCMANLFAFRATLPIEMMASKDPIGKENDVWLYKLANEAAIIVAAWGNDGSYLNRSEEIMAKLLNLYCIKMNKSGEPAHPLYLKADLMPVPIRNLRRVQKSLM